MSRITFFSFVLGVILTCTSVVAHHSFVGDYNATRIISLKGVISNVSYGNPHIFFSVNVAGKGTWRVEAESISKTRAKGLTKKHLKIGNKVTVRGWPARNGSAAIGLQSITLPGGKTIKIRGTAR